MSRVRYDLSKVPREMLEEYAGYHLCLGVGYRRFDGELIAKAAEVRLRTKAEIDSDIITAVRRYVEEYSNFEGIKISLMEMKFKGCFGDFQHRTLPQVLIDLLSEETCD